MTTTAAVAFLAFTIIFAVVGFIHVRSVRLLGEALVRIGVDLRTLSSSKKDSLFNKYEDPDYLITLVSYVWSKGYVEVDSPEVKALGAKARFWLMLCALAVSIELGGFIAFLIISR